jgi:hypothetical protein
MSYCTVGDLDLILADLFDSKKALLEQTLSFKIYGPTLEEQKNEISKITAALQKKPLSEELADTDALHDSTGRAIFHICEAYSQLVTLSQAHRDFAAKVAETFVPSLGGLQKSYEDEAAAAKKRETNLEELKTSLEAFPVAPETSLYTLVSAHIEAGKKIDSLLSARAETTAEDEANRVKQVGVLRSKTIGTINQLREALAHEVSVNQELPRDLESKIFSYYDQIGESREDRHPKKTASETTAS